jgi:hypothetical protein
LDLRKPPLSYLRDPVCVVNNDGGWVDQFVNLVDDVTAIGGRHCCFRRPRSNCSFRSTASCQPGYSAWPCKISMLSSWIDHPWDILWVPRFDSECSSKNPAVRAAQTRPQLAFWHNQSPAHSNTSAFLSPPVTPFSFSAFTASPG